MLRDFENARVCPSTEIRKVYYADDLHVTYMHTHKQEKEREFYKLGRGPL